MGTKHSDFRYIPHQLTLFEGIESRSEERARAKAETQWLLSQPPPVRYVLIGCCAEKKQGDHLGMLPSELYLSQLFKARLRYVRERRIPWYVMSARYGLVGRNDLIRNYDTRLAEWSKAELASWHMSIAFRLLNDLCEDDDPRRIVVELHAGKEYCEPADEHLRTAGFTVERPLMGMGIGEQLGWYKRQHQIALT